MSLSGSVVLWEMKTLGFEKGEESAVTILIIFFKLSVMSPAVLQDCNVRQADCLLHAYITHNATEPLCDSTGDIYQMTSSFFWSHKRLYTARFTHWLPVYLR